jgi:hypothetical protein
VPMSTIIGISYKNTVNYPAIQPKMDESLLTASAPSSPLPLYAHAIAFLGNQINYCTCKFLVLVS